MAARSWATSIFTAIGVAAGAGAAQLGLGYGLGIISWQPTDNSATVWTSSLAWVAWLASSSTVIGALCADRLSPADTPVPADAHTPAAYALTAAWRFVIALSAAVGALITVPLVAVPSRLPTPDNSAPYFTVGGYAIAGIIIGLVLAVCVLAARAVAANIIATTSWLWLLAVIAVADVVRADGNLATAAQLGTWQFTDGSWINGTVNLPSALLMLFMAFVIGGLAAWPAGRRGDSKVGVALSGAAGPALVALAYLLAQPSFGERDQHLSAFVIAPYAIFAGLAGSVIVSAIGPRGSRAEAKAARKAAAEQREARSAADISDWAQALAEADAAKARRDDTDPAGFDDPDFDKTDADRADAARTAAGTTDTGKAATSRAVAGKADAGSTGTGKAGTDRPVTASPVTIGGKSGRSDKPAALEPISVGAGTDLDSTKNLEDDAYAPSRAYGGADKSGRTYSSESANRAYAEDTFTDDEPSPPPAKSAASGRASVEPLWPTADPDPETKPAPQPRSKSRGRAKPPTE